MKIKITDHLPCNNGAGNIVCKSFMRALCDWSVKNPNVKFTDSPFYSTSCSTWSYWHHDAVIDIQLIVNGTEVPFDAIMQVYEDEFDSLLGDKARRILTEKAQKMMDILYEMERDLKEKALELFLSV
jgi:hypothetical protein